MAPVGTLPQGEEKTRRVRAMFDAIAPRYDLVNRVVSLGLDQRWRTSTVRALGLPAGSVVLDLACGTGALTLAADEAGLRPIGADLSGGMLAQSRAAAPLLEADAAALPLRTACLDGIVCGFGLRNFTDLPGSIAEAARVLRDGGRLALLEVGDPQGTITRAGYRLWFEQAVPRLGALLSDRDAYAYLPRSVAYLPAPESLAGMLQEAGFSGVQRHLLTGGLAQRYVATRRAR